MRLCEFLNNIKFKESDIEIFKTLLKRDCKPILKIYSETDGLIIRETTEKKTKYSTPFLKFRVRKNRRPSDTEPIIHDYLDNLFKKMFGWGVRSEGLWTRHAWPERGYSSFEGIVFPIGNFKYVYSPKINDLTLSSENLFGIDIWENVWRYEFDNEEELMEYLEEKITPKVLKDIGYTDKNLNSVLNRKKMCEISINCDEYYLVNQNFIEYCVKSGNFKSTQEFFGSIK